MSELVRRDVLPKVDCLWQKVDSYLGLCGNLGMNASRIVLPQQVWLAGEIPVTRQWQKSDSQSCVGTKRKKIWVNGNHDSSAGFNSACRFQNARPR